MMSRLKNSVQKFYMIDTSKKEFWRLVIFIAAFSISVLALVLVRSGILPATVNEVLCGWFTGSTRRMLGAACY